MLQWYNVIGSEARGRKSKRYFKNLTIFFENSENYYAQVSEHAASAFNEDLVDLGLEWQAVPQLPEHQMTLCSFLHSNLRFHTSACKSCQRERVRLGLPAARSTQYRRKQQGKAAARAAPDLVPDWQETPALFPVLQNLESTGFSANGLPQVLVEPPPQDATIDGLIQEVRQQALTVASDLESAASASALEGYREVRRAHAQAQTEMQRIQRE